MGRGRLYRTIVWADMGLSGSITKNPYFLVATGTTLLASLPCTIWSFSSRTAKLRDHFLFQRVRQDLRRKSTRGEKKSRFAFHREQKRGILGRTWKNFRELFQQNKSTHGGKHRKHPTNQIEPMESARAIWRGCPFLPLTAGLTCESIHRLNAA